MKIANTIILFCFLIIISTSVTAKINANTASDSVSLSLFCSYGSDYGACNRQTILAPPQDPTYPLPNELEITPIELTAGNIKVIVPEGYEIYGTKLLEDLQNCFNLLPSFVGINSAYGDAIIAKVYISNDGTELAYYGGGILYYKYNQQNSNNKQNEVISDDPNGWLSPASPTFCANSHEFTHYLVTNTFIPLWANEGIATYSTQIYRQMNVGFGCDIRTDSSCIPYDCRDDGWYFYDYLLDKEGLFDYIDLSRPFSDLTPIEKGRAYSSASCFWRLFDEKFGARNRKEAFRLLGENANLTKHDQADFDFIEDILYSVVDPNELNPLLAEFGLWHLELSTELRIPIQLFEEEDYALHETIKNKDDTFKNDGKECLSPSSAPAEVETTKVETPPAKTTTCTDSDGAGMGLNRQESMTKGTVTGKGVKRNFFSKAPAYGPFTDYCMKDGKVLIEYYCSKNKFAMAKKVTCKYGCKDGVCMPESVATTSKKCVCNKNLGDEAYKACIKKCQEGSKVAASTKIVVPTKAVTIKKGFFVRFTGKFWDIF